MSELFVRTVGKKISSLWNPFSRLYFMGGIFCPLGGRLSYIMCIPLTISCHHYWVENCCSVYVPACAPVRHRQWQDLLQVLQPDQWHQLGSKVWRWLSAIWRSRELLLWPRSLRGRPLRLRGQSTDGRWVGCSEYAPNFRAHYACGKESNEQGQNKWAQHFLIALAPLRWITSVKLIV